MEGKTTADRWRLIRKLFAELSEKSADERESLLELRTKGDPNLRQELEQLLQAQSTTSASIEDIIAEAASDIDRTEPLNDQIQNYRIERLIGEGGMGQVYLAHRNDQQYEQHVAIKVLGIRRPTKELVRRFIVERQILATLEHPNIARLLDGGETEDGAPFLVMEYIEGKPVDKYCDDQKLSTKQRLKLFESICSAIDFAHRNLIVHRDIKPSNIMINDAGEPKLLDFGIAKMLEDDADGTRTRSGARLMSPLHASPEQVRGQRVTIATDIYSLGVMLYEILTGQHPYQIESSDALSVERAICETEPPRPSARITQSRNVTSSQLKSIAVARSSAIGELTRELGGDLDNIVLKAMHKDPALRYQSVNELAGDIRNFLSDRPVNARPSSLIYRTKKLLQRNKLPSAIAATGLIALASTISFSIHRIANERDLANQEREKAVAINSFMQNIFESASPNVARGEKTTAKELLEIGARDVQDNFQQQPETKASMLRVLGEAYYFLGNTKRANQLIDEALETPDDILAAIPEELATLNLLKAFMLQDIGQLEKAEKLYERAKSIRQDKYGQQSLEVAEVISSLAYLAETKGELDEAIATYDEAFELVEQIIDGDHELKAEIMSKQSGIFRLQRKREKAEPLIMAALAMQQRMYGQMHPLISDTKRQLAGLYRDFDESDKSEQLYLEVIDERREMLGPDHNELGNTYNSYAQLLANRDDHQGAIEVTKKLLRILDVNHDGLVLSHGAVFNNLALYYKELGNYDVALEHYQKSIEALDAVGLAKDHLYRSFAIYGIGNVYNMMGRYKEAEQAHREGLMRRTQHFDVSHLYVSQARNGLAWSLINLNKLDEAEDLLKTSEQHVKQHQGEEHQEYKIILDRLESIEEKRRSILD